MTNQIPNKWIKDTGDVTVSWVIQDLIPERSNVMVFGESNHGKSFYTVDMACSVASGTPFHGYPVKQGWVVYIAGEDSQGILKRIKAWQDYHNTGDLPILLVEEPDISIAERGDTDLLISTIEQRSIEMGEPPTLIILDTMASLSTGAEENSARDMSMVLSNVKRIRKPYETSIIIVHHSGLSATTRVRGSSAIKASMDVEIRVTMSNRVTHMSVTKMKNSLPIEDISLKLSEHRYISNTGEEVASALLLSESMIEDSLGPNELILYRIIKSMFPLEGDEYVLDNEDIEKVRPVFYEKYEEGGGKYSSDSFRRTTRSLQKRGILAVF